MAGALPDLTARVRLDTSDLEAGVKRGSAFGSALGSAFGNLAAGGIGAALGKVREFAGGAVDAFAAVEDATGAAGVQFGSALPTVLSFADKAGASFGLSKRAAIEAQNSFGTLGKAAGLQGEPLAKFSGDLTGLAGDLASFKGTSTEQAIEAVGAALRGETEPIRAYGVLLDDATLRAEAVTLGLIKNVKEGLTPQQKALAAQSAILKQTTDAQGDYARTSDSTANTQKTLAAATEDAQAALGEKLAPAVTALRGGFLKLVQGASGLIDTIGRIANSVQPAVQAFSAGLAPAVDKVVPTLKALVAAIPAPVLKALAVVVGTVAAAIVVQTVATAAASLATSAWALVTGPFVAVKNAEGAVIARGTVLRLAHNVATVATTVATTAWAAATTVATVALRVLNAVAKANPFILLATVVIGLVAAFITAYKTSDTFRAKVDAAFQAVKQVITSVLTAVGAFITRTWAAIKATFTSALAAIKATVTGALGAVKAVFTTVLAAVGAAVTAYFTAYKAVVTAVLNAVKAVVTTVWAGIKTVFTTVLSAITSVLERSLNGWRTIITTVLNAAKAVVTSVFGAIKTVFTSVLGAITGVVTTWASNLKANVTAVLNAVKGVITSGLNAAKAVFSSVFGAITGVVSGALNAVKGAVSGALGAIRGAISSGLSSVGGLFGSAFRAAVGAVQGAIGSVIGVVAGVRGRITGALGNLGGLLVNAGRELMAGLARGIGEKISAVVNKVKEAAAKIKSLLPGSPVKAGPLTSWNRGGAGKRLMGLLEDGITAKAPDVQRAVAKAVNVPLPDLGAGVRASGVGPLAASRQPGRRPGLPFGAGDTYNLELYGVDLSRDPGGNVVAALRRMELLTR